MSIWKAKVGHLTTLPDCPYPWFWPEIWKWKDLKSMMDSLALLILYKFNLKMKKKILEIQLNQWLLWAQSCSVVQTMCMPLDVNLCVLMMWWWWCLLINVAKVSSGSSLCHLLIDNPLCVFPSQTHLTRSSIGGWLNSPVYLGTMDCTTVTLLAPNVGLGLWVAGVY